MPFVEEVIEAKTAASADPAEDQVKHDHERCRLQCDARKISGTVNIAGADRSHQKNRENQSDRGGRSNHVTENEADTDEGLRHGNPDGENLPIRNHGIFKEPTKPLRSRRKWKVIPNVFRQVGFGQEIALKSGDRVFKVIPPQKNAQARNRDQMADIFKAFNECNQHDFGLSSRGRGLVNQDL